MVFEADIPNTDMQNQRAWLVIGLLAFCCISLLLSLVYPVGSATPHAETPSDEQFWVSDTEPCTMTGQIVVDDNQQFGFKELVTTSGERYQRVDESKTTTERYQSASNATIYERINVSAESNVNRMREQLTSDETQELLKENSSDDHVTFIVATNGSDPTVDFSNPAAVVARSLHVVGYESTNHELAAHVVYEPQGGWYGDSKGYRITNTTGKIHVNGETDTVEAASVSWDVTDPADSYAQYVTTRLTSTDPSTHEVSLELQAEEPEVNQPTWMPET